MLMNRSSDFSDSQDDLAASNFAALLQRSRSSRVRKPLSIRAAMQQASTYSNLSRSTTSNSSRTSKSNHSATPSTSTIQSRQSSTPSSISHAGSTQSLTAVTVDLHDASAHTASSRKPPSEAARRKRPAFLALRPEESNVTLVEGRDVHTRRQKDQLRRSSPTVGQNFRFVPGEPPLSGLPPPPPLSKDVHTTKVPSNWEDIGELHEGRRPSSTFPLEPLSSPPTAPLPKPPSRSPSRSRSPARAPKIPKRAPSRTTRASSRQGYIDRHPVSAPGSQQITPLEEEPEHQCGPEKSKAVVPHEEPDVVQQTFEAGNDQTQPVTPPADESPMIQNPSPSILELKKQKSSPSVRSLIIGLPQTARLRKGASAEALRKQPSIEQLYPKPEMDEPVPDLPMIGVVGSVRGNAFGRQSHTSMSPPPRISSIEGFSERNRKRSATDLRNGSQKYVLPLRAQHGMGRSASDARRPQHLRFPAPQRMHDGYRQSPPTSASLSSPSDSLGSPLSQKPTSADSESWPLTPEGGHTSDYNYSSNYLSHHATQNLQPGGGHSRNTFSEKSFALSESTSQTLPPQQAPRAIRSTASYSLTPSTGRSRNNTLVTINSEAGTGEVVDEGMSTVASTAPSAMSAQWYRTPQERLGLGTRVNRAEALPWEESDGPYEESVPRVPPRPKAPPGKMFRKGSGVNMFSVFPPRAPSRMREKDDRINASPPRSPLLTPSFLSGVQTTLPLDMVTKVHVIEDMPRPSTSMNSREGANTPAWSRTKSTESKREAKEEKKKKKKKEGSRFPTLGDMVKEYKAMTHIRYTSTYAQAAEEQRIEKEIREGKRPNTSSMGSTRLGATTSLDIQNPSFTIIGNDSDRSNTLRTMHSNLHLRPSTDSSSSYSETISDHSIHRVDSNATYLDATDTAAREKADKKKKRERKKSSAFPSVKEMWSEYKKSADSWYTSAYQEEGTRNVATPASHFS